MLIQNQKILTKWNSYTKKYYIDLGYKFTKIGEEFFVDIKDLQLNSNLRVSVICDYCKQIYNPIYKNYNACLKKDEIKKDCCKKCKQIKTKEIFLNKYGVDAYLKTEDFKNKTKKTISKKYGVDNISKLESVKNKRKQTNLKKFGTEWYIISEEFKNLSIQKYGVDNPMKNEDIKQKATLTLIKNNNVKISKQEIALCDILKSIYGEENCIPSYQYHNFTFDCLLKVKNCLIDIEYDGTYWHNQRKSYDRRRDEIIKKNGFKILRVESEKDRVPTKEQIMECIDYLVAKNDNKYSHIKI